jgi:hypothetical protein
MIISSLFATHGFSKKIVRKLQHLPGISSVHVWSLWHAESFYKQLEFTDVYPVEKSHPGKPTRQKRNRQRVEGECGPLLMWNKEKGRQLKTRDSMISLAGIDG